MTNEIKKAIEIVKAYLNMDSDVDSEYLNAQRTIIQALEAQPTDKGEISDGYHTFNQLYHQRAILFATIVNQNKDKAWKSFKHSDGHYCFDENGEMFIVGIDTPKGSYTYHYHKKYWDYFDCKELEYGKVWDGHTEEDVTRLLSLEQEPCEDAISREAVLDELDKYIDKAQSTGTRDDFISFQELVVKSLPSVTPSYNSIKSELKPCEDCVSREAVLNLFRPSEELQDSTLSKHWFDFVSKYINKLPSVQLQKKKGKWIVTEDDLDGVNFPSFSCECSECGADFSWKTDFCPGCGAEMESEDKE